MNAPPRRRSRFAVQRHHVDAGPVRPGLDLVTTRRKLVSSLCSDRERQSLHSTAYRLHCLLRFSLCCGGRSSPTGCSSIVRYFGEVAVQRFESISLLIDFVCSTDASAAEKWH